MFLCLFGLHHGIIVLRRVLFGKVSILCEFILQCNFNFFGRCEMNPRDVS